MLKFLNVKMTKRGFTLLEVLVATFIITVGIIGTFSLVSRTIYSANISSKRLIVAYLAQEGIEIVRNIRDTNWLEQTSWNDGLTGCLFPAGCEADYEDQALAFYQDRKLYIDNNGFFSYSPSATQTGFKRRITVTPNGSDILKVSVWVGWQGKIEITAQENLYDWRQ